MHFCTYPKLFKGAAHITLTRNCKHFTGVLSIYKNYIVTFSYKLSFVQDITRRFSSQVFCVKTNILPLLFHTIYKATNISKSYYFPCIREIKITVNFNSIPSYLLIILANALSNLLTILCCSSRGGNGKSALATLSELRFWTTAPLTFPQNCWYAYCEDKR